MYTAAPAEGGGGGGGGDGPAQYIVDLRRPGTDLVALLLAATEDTETLTPPETMEAIIKGIADHPLLYEEVIGAVYERLWVDSTTVKHKILVMVSKMCTAGPAGFHNATRANEPLQVEIKKLMQYVSTTPHPTLGDKPQMMIRHLATNLVNQLEAERVQGNSKEERKAEKQAKKDAKKAAAIEKKRPTGGGMMMDPFIGTQQTPGEDIHNPVSFQQPPYGAPQQPVHPASLQMGLVAPGSAPMQFVQSGGCVSRATSRHASPSSHLMSLRLLGCVCRQVVRASDLRADPIQLPWKPEDMDRGGSVCVLVSRPQAFALSPFCACLVSACAAAWLTVRLDHEPACAGSCSTRTTCGRRTRTRQPPLLATRSTSTCRLSPRGWVTSQRK